MAIACRRLPAWRQHALVVLWAVAAAHGLRFAVKVAAGSVPQAAALASPLSLFRRSGLEALATVALVLRVRRLLPLG